MIKEDKIKEAINEQLSKRGYVTIVDTFMLIGILDKKDYENWRFARVPYLEKVCKCNLSKISKNIKFIRSFCKDKLFLKERYTCYMKYGKGNIRLRFSKSGNEHIEKIYSTHFVDTYKNRKEKQES